MAEVKWTEAQRKAIDSRGGNVLVSAAAGSGKTAVLVERVIKMILDKNDPVDIDKMVIMTFTRAAAGSMRGKIYSAIREKLSKDPENSRLKEQLLKVYGAKICTIDSLCVDIVRENFQQIDVDPAFRIADEAEIKILNSQVLSDLIEKKYAQGSKDFLNFVDYYMDKNDSRLDEIILGMYRFSQSHPAPKSWLRECVSAYKDAGNFYLNSRLPVWMDEFAVIVDSMLAEIKASAEYALKLSQADHGPYPYEDIFREILEFTEDLDDKPFDYRRINIAVFLEDWPRMPIIKKDMDVDPELKELASEIRKEIKEQLQTLMDDYLFQPLEDMMKDIAGAGHVASQISGLTIEFSDMLMAAKKERNILDFSDIAHYALKVLIRYDDEGNILRDETGNILYTAAADNMANFYDAIIVDEYQDTNLMQEYLVHAISGDRFNKADVFMVGDIKQSIYGFRMAAPELFAEKYDRFSQAKNSEGSLINLDRNFRSHYQLLDFVNDIFGKLMIRDVGRIDYKMGHELKYDEAEKSAQEDLLPEIHIISAGGSDGKVLEGYKIAGKIEELVNSGRYGYSDIAILTRSSDNPELEKILSDLAIPFMKASNRGFFQSFEIRLILNYLNVIDNPYQDIDMASVLMSPVCSQKAEDLARLRIAGGRDQSLYECLKVSGMCPDFMELLSDLRANAAYMPVCSFLEYFLKKTGLNEMVLAMPAGSQRRANIEFFKEKAAAFSRVSEGGLYDLLCYIRELKDSGVDYGNAASSASSAVQLMTIHKSKGLEFPVVFLANAGKAFNESDIRDNVVMDRDMGLGLEFRDPKKRLVRKTMPLAVIKHKKKTDTIAEEMRLLYVALTRAKEKLIISGCDSSVESHIRRIWDRQDVKDVSSLSASKILKCGSYIKMIGAALYGSRDSGRFDLQIENEIEIEEARADQILTQSFLKEKLLESCGSVQDTDDIKERVTFDYPYMKAARIIGKIAASQMEKHDYYDTKEQIKMAADLPSSALKGADRGNAYHRFFELMDYETAIDRQLSELCEKGMISPEYAQGINADDVQAFLDSDIGKRMRAAALNGRLVRERSFVMGYEQDINSAKTITASDVRSDLKDVETLLVQGIIDAYFTEEDEEGPYIVIVDYKTDNNSDEEYYRYSYGPQLEVYENALQAALGLKVKEKIIYSVKLAKAISL